MNTFHFDPSRIHDPILRQEAITLHFEMAARQVKAPPSPLRAVEGERSDELGEGAAS